jgi:hypothetical protein
MMYWQMTHIRWHFCGKTILHDIWLVELMADLHKVNFILLTNLILSFNKFYFSRVKTTPIHYILAGM